MSPWDFDSNNGGFSVGLAAPSDETAADTFNIHNWGEDKNFNNIEDGICGDDEAISCYIFGVGTDARCPTPTSQCLTKELNTLGTVLRQRCLTVRLAEVLHYRLTSCLILYNQHFHFNSLP